MPDDSGPLVIMIMAVVMVILIACTISSTDQEFLIENEKISFLSKNDDNKAKILSVHYLSDKESCLIIEGIESKHRYKLSYVNLQVYPVAGEVWTFASMEYNKKSKLFPLRRE